MNIKLLPTFTNTYIYTYIYMCMSVWQIYIQQKQSTKYTDNNKNIVCSYYIAIMNHYIYIYTHIYIYKWHRTLFSGELDPVLQGYRLVLHVVNCCKNCCKLFQKLLQIVTKIVANYLKKLLQIILKNCCKLIKKIVVNCCKNCCKLLQKLL